MLWKFSRCFCRLKLQSSLKFHRWMSANKSVKVNVNSEGIAQLYLNSPPVNTLTSDVLVSIIETVNKLSNESSVRGVILTSAINGRVFCAGLNINDLYQKSLAHYKEYWGYVQDWYLTIYGCPKPTVAAINGHAPAGGCAMGLMTDYMVMQEGKSIGLNEVQVGIAPRMFVGHMMLDKIGYRKGENAILRGTTFSSKEALNIGLVDCVVDKNNVMKRSLEEIKKLVLVPIPAFSATKLLLRQKHLDYLRNFKEQDTKTLVKYLDTEEVQTTIGNYLNQLKSKTKK